MKSKLCTNWVDQTKLNHRTMCVLNKRLSFFLNFHLPRKCSLMKFSWHCQYFTYFTSGYSSKKNFNFIHAQARKKRNSNMYTQTFCGCEKKVFFVFCWMKEFFWELYLIFIDQSWALKIPQQYFKMKDKRIRQQ